MLGQQAGTQGEPRQAPPNEEVAEGDVDLGRRFFNFKTLLSFVVAFVLLYVLFRNVRIDLATTLQTIRQANVGLYLVGFLIYYCGFVLRGWRWQRMLEDARNGDGEAQRRGSVGQLAQIIYISWFANCLIPAKLGDLVRAYMLKRDLNVRFLKGMGTILAERLIDLAVLLVLLSLAAVVSLHDMLPDELARALELGFALVLVALVGLLLMHRLDDLVQRFLPERLRERYARFYEGILRSFHSLPFVLPLTVLIWLSEAGRLVFVTWALGLRLSDDLMTELLMLLFIALAAAALTALPVTPGGLGLVEALIVQAFTWGAAATGMRITNELVWSVAILDRSISYGSIVVLGLVVYLFSRRK